MASRTLNMTWNKSFFLGAIGLSAGTTFLVTTKGEMKAATKEKKEIGQKHKLTGTPQEKALAGHKILQENKSKSLLKKHLTPEVLAECNGKKTKLGATLWDVISSGVENENAGVGVYAPDAESYTTFAPLMDPIIESYHGFKPNQKQPAFDMGEGKTKNFPPLDKEGKYIKSTRIRCGRSVQGKPFNPLLKEKDYLDMEENLKGALKAFTGDLKGTYYPLVGMTKETRDKLVADHFLFKEGDSHLQAANACNYWPKGRGIFHNDDKTFLIWSNEEDHMRIISMQEGSDVGTVLERLIKGVKIIEKKIAFSRDERLGWLTFCPTNLGSTIRASVHIKLPLISARKDWKETCEKLNLQVRGIHGEHSESEGGVFDISNKARLGLSEYEAVKQMYDGVKKLIEMEKEAEKNGKKGNEKKKDEKKGADKKKK